MKVKKIISGITLGLCLTFSISGQIQQKQDSLIALFTQYVSSDYDSAELILAQIDSTQLTINQHLTLIKNHSDLLRNQRKYDRAVEILVNAIKNTPSEAEYATAIAGFYDAIGYIYNNNQKNFDLAEDYYNDGLALRNRYKLNSELGKSYYGLGSVALRKSQHKKAINLFKLALSEISGESQLTLAAGLNYTTGMAYNTASSNEIPNNVDSAAKYLKSAKGMYEAMGNTPFSTTIAMEEAGLLIKLGRYRECIENLEGIINMPSQKFDLDFYIRIYGLLAEANKSTENYKDAYFYVKAQSDSLRQSINDSRLKETAQITEDFRTDKQLDEAEATAFFASRKARIFGIALIVLAVILIISYLLFVQTLQKKKLENLQAMVMGEEQERKRVAKDLHDGIGVLLTSVKLRLSNFEDKVDDKKGYQNSLQQIDNACTEVRRISHNMVPASLTKLGIEEAILDLLDNVKASTQIEIKDNIEVKEGLLSEEKEVLIYRVIQELINNSIKYAEAKTISLTIKSEVNHLKITYKDDGKGFDKSEIKAGIGLKSIASRIDILKGKLNIDTAPGAGTQFDINLPLYG